MSTLITVQDILDQTNDLARNYTTGTVDQANRLRAVNRAVEYVKRRLTMPADLKDFSFYFSRDQLYYPGPSDMNEPINLVYTNANENTPSTRWNWIPYSDLLSYTGTNRGNFWSHTWVNGSLQIVMLGFNLHAGTILQTFDSVGNFTGENDAINLSINNNIYTSGGASLEFTISPVLAFGKGSIYFPVNWDISTMHQANGTIKLDTYLPSTNLTSINLVLGTDASDYYVFTCTTTDDGNPFTINQWNTLHWSFLDGPVIVGSPSDQDINFARIDYIQNGSFGSTDVTGFFMDNMYLTFPDQMSLTYNTMYKGTDTTGVTNKVFFTANSDIPYFGQYAPDLLTPIAYRAAYMLEPQLRADKDFMKEYKDECEEVLKIYGRVFPRQRVITLGSTRIQRP